MVKNYQIKLGYNHRTEVPHFDDTSNKAEHQRPVYELAQKIMTQNHYTYVVDVGCGSGFKLINLMSPTFLKVGIEVEPTLSWLRLTYPDMMWRSPDDCLPPPDLVICSDVIEHVQDPEEFLQYLHGLDAKEYLISTPERDIVRGVTHMGPPQNPWHVREWNTDEFRAFLDDCGFRVTHTMIANRLEGTLMVRCVLK